MGKLFLSGPKATEVAQHIFSRDVTDPSRQGKCTYTLMLNPFGGIESDLVVATMKDKNKGMYLNKPPTTRVHLQASSKKLLACNTCCVSDNYCDLDPVYYMTVGGMTTEYCKAHIKKIMHDCGIHCRLEDKTDEMGIISIQGPNRYLTILLASQNHLKHAINEHSQPTDIKECSG